MGYRNFWIGWFAFAAVFWMLVARDWISALHCLVITGSPTLFLLHFRSKQKAENHEPPLR